MPGGRGEGPRASSCSPGLNEVAQREGAQMAKKSSGSPSRPGTPGQLWGFQPLQERALGSLPAHSSPCFLSSTLRGHEGRVEVGRRTGASWWSQHDVLSY